jgi:hypothetical protein
MAKRKPDPDLKAIDEAMENTAPSPEDLRVALEQSVKLQTHYAQLLNMHDGGERIGFASADAWITRLRETGTLPPRRRR